MIQVPLGSYLANFGTFPTKLRALYKYTITKVIFSYFWDIYYKMRALDKYLITKVIFSYVWDICYKNESALQIHY